MIKFEGAIGSTLVQYVTHSSAPTRVVEGRMNMKVSRRDDTVGTLERGSVLAKLQ